ncbi:MAG TPA: DoxX family membrane protein [Patescibacteria group bacterium]|nr:DoxX family membrane protein [Patescibacteria group bacterium]
MHKNATTVNDYSLAWLRIAVGILFLIFAQYKVWGPQFAHGGFADWIHLFLRHGAYPFMVPVLRGFVLAHAKYIAYLVGYGELCIGLGLLLGILVRGASFFGVIYMGVLLLSSNYPGPHAAIWQYVGASLNHLVFALCFVAFGMGDATRVWSVPSYYRRKLRHLAEEAMEKPDTSFIASNVFGK